MLTEWVQAAAMSGIGAIAPADKPAFVEARLAPERDGGKGSLPRRPRKPRPDDEQGREREHALSYDASRPNVGEVGPVNWLTTP